jgi:hypothetical protein
MTSSLTGRSPAPNLEPRLSDADRSLMLSVADREWAQGKISFEEYEYIQDRCRVRPGAALAQRLLKLTGRRGVARFPFGQPGDPILSMLKPHTESVPVSSVVGSVDRAAHLDRTFRPIHGGRARLESIRRAMEAGVPFEPIEVYRLAGACYVIDGHHRVAAARLIGQLYLDAMVTECWPQGIGSLHPLETARVAFALRTGVHTLAFSTPERYSQALHQVHDHRWYLGERGRVVGLPEAAEDWYYSTYLPVLQEIVAEGLAPLDKPSEAGDRYFDLCDLKERLGRARGRDVGFAEALHMWAPPAPHGLHLPFGRRVRVVRLS